MADTPNFLLIPGNIKQEFAPFVINPGAAINSTYASSPQVSGPPQYFSFKQSRIAKKGLEASGLLNMFPSSMALYTDMFKKDLSFSSCNIDGFSGLLDLLPSILIREYLPDTKLDQCINLFNDIFTKIFSSQEKDTDLQKAGEAVMKEIKDGIGHFDALKERLSRVVNRTFEVIESRYFLDKATSSVAQDQVTTAGANVDARYSYIVKFPFTLMYNLQSCVTTNVYELPCVPSNNAMHESHGAPGWGGNAGWTILPSAAKSIPILGKMLDTLFGNMRINFTPWWDSDAGSKTAAPTLEFKFSLFNDSANAAVNNFIFVNTIIQNNRWLQYHLFLHSSNLYDVTIAGIGKQYACTADFSVLYKGSLRKVSSYVKDLLKKHVGNRYKASAIVTDELIKIPDVYDITMKFNSVLPLNFNTFIYNYMSQDSFNIGSNVYHDSAFSGIGDAIKVVINQAAIAWKQAKENVKDDYKSTTKKY